MEVTCKVCGNPFNAKRRTARFCSSNCRVRSHRGGQVVELKKPTASKPKAKASNGKDEQSGPAVGTVEAAAIRTLQEADRLDTVMGQAALVLARRLDTTTMDTGSAVAGVVKQLELAMEAATAGANTAADPIDELRNRRDRKLGIVG